MIALHAITDKNRAELPVKAGLVLRYSADRQTDAEILIDLSGNGYNAVKVSTGSAILVDNAYNGKKTLRFTGPVNYRVDFPEISQPNSIIAICRSIQTSGTEVMYDGVGSGFRHLAFTSNGVWRFGSGLAPAAPAGSEYTNLDLFLHYTEFYSPNGKFYADNVLKYTQDWGTNPIKGVFIGSNYVSGGYTTNDISEFIVYNRQLTGIERNEVSNYLMTMYGL